MIINKIELNNWRNYQKRGVKFDNNLNILVGDNAVGKTNILEAVYTLSITKSFRVNRDISLINRRQGWAKIIGNYQTGSGENHELEIRLVVDENGNLQKEIKSDGLRIRALDMLGKLRSVIFSPDEIEKFFTSPARRRRWMDLALCAVDSRYAYNLMVYKKVLHNRNKLLKKIFGKKQVTQEIDFWNNKWLELTEYIVFARRNLIDEINTVVGGYFKEIFDEKDLLELNYQQSYFGEELKSGLKQLLESNWDKDVRYGSTSSGPHREDVEVILNGVKIVEWGSRAQMRLSLLAIKLAEAVFLTKQTKDKPILLLDDIFSELDEKKQTKVVAFIRDYQCLITATLVPEQWSGKVISLSGEDSNKS